MKYSDIEQKIKKENDEMDVPDVLMRVKHSPLHHLPLNGTPTRMFKKRIAVFLLTLTLTLVLVISLAILAMDLNFAPKKSDSEAGNFAQSQSICEDVDTQTA